MRRAYTVVRFLGTPHLDVGPTYSTKEKAIEDGHREDDLSKVVCHVDDFHGQHGYLMFRTDGIHEVSLVVDEELDRWDVNQGVTCYVATRFKA